MTENSIAPKAGAVGMTAPASLCASRRRLGLRLTVPASALFQDLVDLAQLLLGTVLADGGDGRVHLLGGEGQVLRLGLSSRPVFPDFPYNLLSARSAGAEIGVGEPARLSTLSCPHRTSGRWRTARNPTSRRTCPWDCPRPSLRGKAPVSSVSSPSFPASF